MRQTVRHAVISHHPSAAGIGAKIVVYCGKVRVFVPGTASDAHRARLLALSQIFVLLMSDWGLT